jgi:hypothetical protein
LSQDGLNISNLIVRLLVLEINILLPAIASPLLWSMQTISTSISAAIKKNKRQMSNKALSFFGNCRQKSSAGFLLSYPHAKQMNTRQEECPQPAI